MRLPFAKARSPKKQGERESECDYIRILTFGDYARNENTLIPTLKLKLTLAFAPRVVRPGVLHGLKCQ